MSKTMNKYVTNAVKTLCTFETRSMLIVVRLIRKYSTHIIFTCTISGHSDWDPTLKETHIFKKAKILLNKIVEDKNFKQKNDKQNI
jgi:hypothetical protein